MLRRQQCRATCDKLSVTRQHPAQAAAAAVPSRRAVTQVAALQQRVAAQPEDSEAWELLVDELDTNRAQPGALEALIATLRQVTARYPAAVRPSSSSSLHPVMISSCAGRPDLAAQHGSPT
jgi:thioredoxin-like negative regulator of GroEL